ncbi:YoaK family protein [Comamonas sp.]
MRRLRHLTGSHRTSATNRALGYLMAFNAGAINAAGFMVLHLYTSHMTGFLSMLADHLVLGNTALVLAALGALLAFTTGAAVSAILVNWARLQGLRSTYALPLLLVAVLMLLFGLVGAITMDWKTLFAVPMTVLLLSFTMGVQNATLTKMSNATIRTTHMTGVVTDLGIELGKMLFWNRLGSAAQQKVHANWQRVRLFGGLLLMFLVGGIAGALGFQHWGFVCVVPLALLLMAVSLPPLWVDGKKLRHRYVSHDV